MATSTTLSIYSDKIFYISRKEAYLNYSAHLTQSGLPCRIWKVTELQNLVLLIRGTLVPRMGSHACFLLHSPLVGVYTRKHSLLPRRHRRPSMVLLQVLTLFKIQKEVPGLFSFLSWFNQFDWNERFRVKKIKMKKKENI